MTGSANRDHPIGTVSRVLLFSGIGRRTARINGATMTADESKQAEIDALLAQVREQPEQVRKLEAEVRRLEQIIEELQSGAKAPLNP